MNTFKRALWAIGLLILLVLVYLTKDMSSAPALHGRLVDPLGRPLAGGTVGVVGLKEVVSTDEDGAFALPYHPGNFRVRASASGHYPPPDLELEVTALARVELADLVMTPHLPSEVGVYQLTDRGWRDLQAVDPMPLAEPPRWARGVKERLPWMQVVAACPGPPLAVKTCGGPPEVEWLNEGGKIASGAYVELQELAPDSYQVPASVGHLVVLGASRELECLRLGALVHVRECR